MILHVRVSESASRKAIGANFLTYRQALLAKAETSWIPSSRVLHGMLASDVNHADRHPHHAFGVVSHRQRQAAHGHLVAELLGRLSWSQLGKGLIPLPPYHLTWRS
jgi:hypothetical protein